MACEHDDCFTCPYKDCIKNTEPKVDKVKKKPGRKKKNPEEVRQHRLEWQRKYNAEHKDKIYAYMKEYYKEHKAEYRAREKKNRMKRSLNNG
jgi:hypothetical protein